MAVAFPGWQDLVICGETPLNPASSLLDIHHPCEFSHLVLLARHLIHDLVLLSTIFAVVTFIWIGFQLMTSVGNPGKRSQALKAFKNVGIGYVFILSAWLIIYTITSTLLYPGYSILIGSPK
jgi:hypothetical protein